MAPLAVRREMQLRDAGRGCLLALVLEGAAILSGVLWLITWMFSFHRLATAAAVAFFAFTIAAFAVGLLVAILGNTPAQRRLRAEAARLEASQSKTADPEIERNAVADGRSGE